MGRWEYYAVKSMDVVLFTFFLILGIAVPVFDPQVAVAGVDAYYPKRLVELLARYASEFEDYLVTDMPHFLTALVWLKLLLQWPLCVANLYALGYRRPWFNTTCLLFGASFFPVMVGVMGEVVGSGRGARKRMVVHSLLLGFAVLAILRGLIPSANNPASIGRKNKKKTT